MSTQLSINEGLIKYLFRKVLNVEFENSFPVITYDDAMEKYGSDKPDTRFEMELSYLEDLAKGKGFKVFDESESIVAISVPGGAEYSRKKLEFFLSKKSSLETKKY